ncbi:MAG: hypothetical protein FWG50_03385 [Kiritimatiellaeota bacterium]|nr:hypothetical protein [Kiritimatiellota bacterium]
MTPMAEWIFEHKVSTGAILVALVLALATVAWTSWRYLPRNVVSGVLVALRLLFLALLFWILLIPGRKSSLTMLIKSRFVILIDRSSSMSQTFEEGRTATRWNTAQDVLKMKWTESVRNKCIVQVYPFHADLETPVALEEASALVPDGRSTHLNLSLNRLFDTLRGQEIAGVLVLSDGIDTREKKDSWAEASWGAPLYVVELEAPGEPDDTPDMRIESVDTPRRAIVGWDTAMSVTVAGQGGKGEPFPVLLLKDGKEQEKIAVTIPPEGGSREVQFKLSHPEVATEIYTVRIPILPGEVQTNDNEMAVAVDVLDARNRVLLLEDSPRQETRFLTRVLFANKDITPLAFFQIPNRRVPGTKEWVAYGDSQGLTFELTADQLRLNKIVILGDFESNAFTPEHIAAILDFVENGGSLILLGGAKFWGESGIVKTDLVKLLPFTRTGAPAIEGKFNVAWTAEGRAHPALANNPDMPAELPPVLSVFTGASLSGGAQALVEAATDRGAQPILVSRIYGQGKVLTVLTDSLWRWNFELGEAKPFQSFWKQIIQWMSPAESEMDQYYLELFTDAGTIAVGDPAVLQGRLVIPPSEAQRSRSWKVQCVVTTPSDREIPLDMTSRTLQTAGGGEIPGYLAEFVPSEPGNYKAVATVEVDGKKIASSPCLFAVRSTSQELVLKPINDKALKSLARFSGGRYGPPAEIDAALQELRATDRRETKLEYRSLWQSVFVLSLLIALLTIEWVVRKLNNLS